MNTEDDGSPVFPTLATHFNVRCLLQKKHERNTLDTSCIILWDNVVPGCYIRYPVFLLQFTHVVLALQDRMMEKVPGHPTSLCTKQDLILLRSIRHVNHDLLWNINVFVRFIVLGETQQVATKQ